MAHNFNSGFFGSGQAAWHGMGTVISGTASVAEGRRLAGLTWEPSERSLYRADGSTIESHKEIYRNDTGKPLGVVGINYSPVGNGEAFDWLDSLMGSGDVRLETAGALDEGRRVWALARVNDEIVLPGGDRTLPYLLVANGHDGSLALSATPTTVRVVCQNTLSLALSSYRRKRDGRGFVLRHTGDVRQKMLDAAATMAAARGAFKRFKERASALAMKSIDRARAGDFIRQVITGPLGIPAPILEAKPAPVPVPVPVPPRASLWGTARSAPIVPSVEGDVETSRVKDRFEGILSDILDRYEKETCTGTAWGAFNACTEQIDHGRRYRSAESRFQSGLIGEAAGQKQQIFELATRTFSA